MVMSSQKRNKIQIIIKPQRNDREDYKMTAININKNNFQNEVMNSDKPVLLDFWAPWCAPCRMVVPIIEEIAGEVNALISELVKSMWMSSLNWQVNLVL